MPYIKVACMFPFWKENALTGNFCLFMQELADVSEWVVEYVDHIQMYT